MLQPWPRVATSSFSAAIGVTASQSEKTAHDRRNSVSFADHSLDAQRDGAGADVLDDQCVGSDGCTLADSHAADDGCPRSNSYSVPNDRTWTARSAVPDGHCVPQYNIGSYDRCVVYDQPLTVVERESWTNNSLPGKLDIHEPFNKDTVDEPHRKSSKLWLFVQWLSTQTSESKEGEDQARLEVAAVRMPVLENSA